MRIITWKRPRARSLPQHGRFTAGAPGAATESRRRFRMQAAERLREQDGFLLIEVIVSTLLVALIVVGTFTAFDAGQRITADQRAKAQATAIAQQDEERLRSLGTSALSSLSETREVTVQNTKYTVISKSQFVSDTAGTPSCSTAGASADYYETTSEVSWPFIGKHPKIVETGLVAPPAGGELSVLIEDGRGGKTSGMTVTGTGPSSFTDTTEANGCVIFGPLEEGTYKVTTSQAGYVGRNGESEPPESERSVSVTGQTTTNKTFEFSKAGSIKATLEARPTGLGGAQTLNVMLAQTGLTLGYRQMLFEAEGGYTKNSISSLATIFPYPSSYGIYAGTCTANEPQKWGGAKPTEVQVEPGSLLVAPKEALIEPALIVLFYKGTKNTEPLVEKPQIFIKDTDSGTECNTTTYQVATYEKPEKTKGDLEQPGLPYGEYTVCAQFVSSGKTKYVVKEKVKNSNIEKGEKVELFEGSLEAKSGKCP
jgi:Tfp pilus assembly protein PilV